MDFSVDVVLADGVVHRVAADLLALHGVLEARVCEMIAGWADGVRLDDWHHRAAFNEKHELSIMDGKLAGISGKGDAGFLGRDASVGLGS